MATKAKSYEALSRESEDPLVLTQAALDSIAITINGKAFRPDRFVRSEDLAELLNISLCRPGDMARFEYDDRSILEETVIKPGKAYIAACSPFRPVN